MNFPCRIHLPAILLVLLAGIVVYSNTFQVPFVLDDDTSIVQNTVIRSLDNFYNNSSGYRFLPNRCVAFLTFALNYHFGGLEVTGYHAINLLIHLVAALLVYALVRLTFHTPAMQGSRLEPRVGWVALLAALLFVIHPVQTQAVTYIVQRMTSMATMFYLLSIVLYVWARLRLELRKKSNDSSKKNDTEGARGSVNPGLLIALSVLSAILAMFTKPIAFTLPLAALLYEACFFSGAWKKRLFYLLPLLATLPIVPLTVIGVGAFSGGLLLENGDQFRVGYEISRLDYLFTQFPVIAAYLRLLILPINQNLDYDHPLYSTFLTSQVFLPFLLLTAILVLAVYLCWRTRPVSVQTHEASPLLSDPASRLIAFGIFWFFLTLSVESSLVPIRDVMVEHRLYLPSFGAAVAFAMAFCLLAEKFTRPASSRLFISLAVLVVVVFGFATFQRNHVWGDAVRLWQDVANKSPNKGRALNNFGVALEEAGRRSEAVKAMRKAIAVDPNYYKSYYNLADLYLVSDQPAVALPLLQTSIRLRPDFTEAYVKLGAALMRGGQFQEVIYFLEQNLNRVKDQAEARFYLGAAHVFLGNREAALRELEVISRLDAALAANLAGLLGLKTNQGVPHGSR